MIIFYRNLRTMPIGKALYEAKRRLRMITIGELRKDYALEQIVEISQRQYSDDYDVPYAHWRYWADSYAITDKWRTNSMRKKVSPKLWNSVELLEINTDRFWDEVQDELGIYNISIQIKSEQMEKRLNDVIEVELEKVQEETEVTRGVVHIIRDGSGKFYSVKILNLVSLNFWNLVWTWFKIIRNSNLFHVLFSY